MSISIHIPFYNPNPEKKEGYRNWYKHRDYPINITIREMEDTDTIEIEEPSQDLEFIPFENFQKTLEN